MDTTPSILLSFAHPDDESFFTAGISCEYTARGARVVLSCATRGEAGTAGDPPLATREELPALRERELRDAAAVLGRAAVKCGFRPGAGVPAVAAREDAARPFDVETDIPRAA